MPAGSTGLPRPPSNHGGERFDLPRHLDVGHTAVSQLVAIIWDGVSAWQVTGSSSGYMGSYSVSGSTAPFPASNTQFLLSITYSGPASGDEADFALIARRPIH